jgi:PAS domain S-box-containing protein
VPRVLIVDDEEGLRLTFKTFLEKEGAEVVLAADFNEAVARLQDAGPFDLVFLDIILPGGLRGIDVLPRIRERGMDCPVIIITGQPQVETAAEAVREGAFDYVPKPVKKETLLRLYHSALSFHSLKTENRRMAEEKDRYKRNLEAVFRSVDEAIIAVDVDGHISSVNSALDSLCGSPASGYTGRRIGEIAIGGMDRCGELIAGTIATGRIVKDQPVIFQCPAGDRRSALVSGMPLKDEQGRSIGGVLVIRDLTRLHYLERELEQRTRFEGMIGRSPAMQKIFNLVEDLADTDATVLITGESGTGKDMLAGAIHHRGSRAAGPLVRVNCAALSESLLESELFGHVKGAFTGADRVRKGRFELAHGGTLFLDEIGDIPTRLQVKLLRALQEKEIERVGDARPIAVDVRLITATNRDLPARIAGGEFREDLYYRIKVLEIRMPPLRSRREDIPLLADHFREHFNRKYNRRVERVSDRVMEIFMDDDWPGNVRQLQHVLEHAFILCREPILDITHLPPELQEEERPPGDTGATEITADRIREALREAGGNKAKAARLLGIARRTLYRRMERLGLTP